MDSEKKLNAVNEALQFPLAEAFEKNLCTLIDAGNQQVVIAVFDLDHFLKVNNDFGHEVGDKVLIETGKHFASDLPEGAVIYRIGGDEFAIIFKGLEKEDVFLHLEEKRRGFMLKNPNGEQLTVSIGVASLDDATRYQELVRKAESAMFRAKVSGRNKVALAKEEKMVPKTSHYTQDQLSELTKLSKKEGIGEAVLLREALDMLLKKYDR